MKRIIVLSVLALSMMSCENQVKENQVKKTTEMSKTTKTVGHTKIEKAIDKNLPTIGILIFEGVIMNEVMAPLDVFSNTDSDGKTLFNVITIATENKTFNSAHGLKVTPDYVIDNIPELEVLVVPSSYNPERQTADEKLIAFVKEQNETTPYIASHCAGAFIIGETGIAKNKEIVTYVTGSTLLQAKYPNLKVADDSKVSVIEDGKFISSNGSLVSYIASFDLLEKLTSKSHRTFVESAILFDRLKA